MSSDELAARVREGRSLVLWGTGGIGKTVYLLELASRLAGANDRPVALYVDAAVWARSSQPIFGYIESHPAAQRAGLTAEALAKFAGLGRLILLVNGWNEIPAHLKVHSRELFSLLTGAFPKLTVVVASRTERETPALDGARVVSVEGLTWSGQVEVVRAELPPQKADILLDRMGKDTNLRHSARSPLILRGLVEQSKRSAAIANTVFDLLGAVVDAFENDSNRNERLADEPLFRRQVRYMEELAFRTSLAGGTDLPRDEALPILTGVHRTLADQGLVDGPAKPDLVLAALASQHLLHLQDNVVRFSHQRFQEYYAARRVLELLKSDLDSSASLRQIVNSPAWEETLELVAEKLKLSGVDGAKSRSRLVEVAHTLDIAYACEIAGLCAFGETDNKVLFEQLIHKVGLLARSYLPEVSHLASACQVATQFEEFAPAVWALVEGRHWRDELPHRYGGGAWLVVKQLGPNIFERIASWTTEHRSGFVQEVVTNPLNFEFVVEVAKSDVSMDVREGAIAALLWHYPASQAALNAWTTAPRELQARARLLGAISSFLDEGLAVEEICEQLRSLADCAPSEQVYALLAKARPDEFGPLVVERALSHLQNVENYGESHTFLSVAKQFAPERALAHAEERIFARRSTPQWAKDLWSAQSNEAQQSLFARAWIRLTQGEPCGIDFEFVGPLAAPRQVTESLSAWLALQSSASRDRESSERKRSIENLLVCARSEHLMQAIFSLGAEAGYTESVALTNVLLRSCGVGAFTADARPTWRPSREQVKQLLDLFGQRCEAPVFPHDVLNHEQN